MSLIFFGVKDSSILCSSMDVLASSMTYHAQDFMLQVFSFEEF